LTTWILIIIVIIIAALVPTVLMMLGFKARQTRIENSLRAKYPGHEPLRCLVVTPGVRVPGMALLLPDKLIFQSTVETRETDVLRREAAIQFSDKLTSGKPVFNAGVVKLRYGAGPRQVEFVVNDTAPWKQWWEKNGNWGMAGID